MTGCPFVGELLELGMKLPVINDPPATRTNIARITYAIPAPSSPLGA